MFDLNRHHGERLTFDAYWADFDKHFWRTADPGFWKLERRQVFLEPTNPSWQAFTAGDWDEALRLMDVARPDLEAISQRIAGSGFQAWWVRIAEDQITPYLQWELNFFRVRAQCGDNIRVVRLDQVNRFETRGQLPELITLGPEVMYEIWYDETGLQQGGVRYVDRDLTTRCQRFIRDLYAEGEDIESFFQREVADLEPPRVR